MIIRLILLLAFVASPCFAGSPHYPTPSHSQIKEWWKPENRERPDEKMDIIAVKPIRLKSGENAFVASVSFPTRGHCCWSGILLARPALQEARQIPSLAGDIDKIISLRTAGFSGVAISGSYMGQGFLSGWKKLLYFDKWESVVLHSISFGDDTGNCGQGNTDRPCRSEMVTWAFVDLDGDGQLDLVESIDCWEGDEPDALGTSTSSKNAFLIKGTKLVPMSPDLTESNLEESREEAKSGHGDSADMKRHENESSVNGPEEPRSGPEGVYTTPTAGQGK